ncbi:hypothetical protein TVAG_113730 [Trichomonas vaginalis G3]|uniref:DUF4200 domain-containing protein n=1 Tax=Trichomonas vaginalis (strain ATCC PRA-98 / G3) TaxID=412133 RepID=A2DNM6_TRIV3|nr:DUF4200 domain family [Trichomonas vaginalis G3]EAY18029.1 hypothetical protein TVAG_113730 [Trichomonas vaginalis G3]KAI5524413.1 DUF4200 domain family [Trichomonas vaginalis G3]|eukprot:XP_001579015.1 hypothetical protein [Trichomonas vaginalis G3]
MKKRTSPRSRNAMKEPKEFEFAKLAITPELAEKRKEMMVKNDELEEAKSKFEEWKVDFQSRKAEIDDKMSKLEDQKRNLIQFTRHHNLELEKAQQREEESKIKMINIRKEIDVLKKEDDQLQSQIDDLMKKINQLQPCADYLQAAVDYSPNFDSVEYMLNRYHSISETRAEFLGKYQNLLMTFGDDSKKLDELLKLRKAYLIDRTMKFNKEIAKYEQTKQQREYRKMSLIKDVQRIEEKLIELSSIKTSIRTIYESAMDRMQSNDARKKAPPASSLTEEQMLIAIQNRFSDLSEIIKAANVKVII